MGFGESDMAIKDEHIPNKNVAVCKALGGENKWQNAVT